MKICIDNEVINPDTNRCIKINGNVFKKIDITKFSINDQEKIKKHIKKCKNNEIINPLTNRCIDKNGILYKKLIKENKLSNENEIIKSNENEIIKSNENEIIKSNENEIIIKLKKKKNKVNCKNDTTFLQLTDIKDIKKSDFIKLSNEYCFSVEELESFIESDTFKNLNPHNSSVLLFNMEKDTIILKEYPSLYKKVLVAIDKLSKVGNNSLKTLFDRLDYLYGLCKMSGIVVFDNLGSFSTKSESFNLSLKVLIKFNDSFGKDIISKKIIYKLKHPKTNDTVKTIIENCNNGSICIHKAGSMLLQIFIYWFMKLEKIYKIKYDISKCKVIFTRVVGNNLYFRQINSKEIHNNGSIYISNLLITPEEFKNSSLFLNNKEHALYKCQHLKNTCVNNEDLYLYTNNYDINTWCDMKDTEIIKLDGNYCFGLTYILEYINNKLNSSNMNNPSPAYPLNPFTNKILTLKDLSKIKKMVLLSQTKVALPLKVFLEDETMWIDNLSKYDKYKTVDKIEIYNLRYKRINSKDSQENYNGYWVYKKTPYSLFENMLYKYMQSLDYKANKIMKKMAIESITYDELTKYLLYSEIK